MEKHSTAGNINTLNAIKTDGVECDTNVYKGFNATYEQSHHRKGFNENAEEILDLQKLA